MPSLPSQLDLGPWSFLPGPEISSQEGGSWLLRARALSLQLPLSGSECVLWCQGGRDLSLSEPRSRGGTGSLGHIRGRGIPLTWSSPAWPPHPHQLLLWGILLQSGQEAWLGSLDRGPGQRRLPACLSSVRGVLSPGSPTPLNNWGAESSGSIWGRICSIWGRICGQSRGL